MKSELNFPVLLAKRKTVFGECHLLCEYGKLLTIFGLAPYFRNAVYTPFNHKGHKGFHKEQKEYPVNFVPPLCSLWFLKRFVF